MSALDHALDQLAAVRDDPSRRVPVALATLEAWALDSGPRRSGVLDQVNDALGDADVAAPLLDLMFRLPAPEQVLLMVGLHVTSEAFEEAVIDALATDDDRAAAAIEIQYHTWGYGAFRHTPAGAARVAAAVADLRARKQPSPRLERALREYEPPTPRA